jgi:hypothetical protein
MQINVVAGWYGTEPEHIHHRAEPRKHSHKTTLSHGPEERQENPSEALIIRLHDNTQDQVRQQHTQ